MHRNLNVEKSYQGHLRHKENTTQIKNPCDFSHWGFRQLNTQLCIAKIVY